MDQNISNTIKQLYYNPDNGFKSIRNTFLDVREIIPDIKYKQVQQWFLANVERKTKDVRGYNSYVAPHAYHQYQCDIFIITDNQLPNQKYTMGLLMIDTFSKYMSVVALESNKPIPLGNAILKSFQLQGKAPDILFSDSEGSLFNKELVQLLDDSNVQIVTTTTHAPFAERAVRTFKNMLFKRIERKQKLLTRRVTGKTSDDIQWIDYIDPIIKQYNKTIHSSTEMSPNNARKKVNEIDVKVNLEMKARRGVKYPELQVGDSVRILKTKKLGDKENKGPFRKNIFKIDSISQNFGTNFYKIAGIEYIRSDLVKVIK